MLCRILYYNVLKFSIHILVSHSCIFRADLIVDAATVDGDIPVSMVTATSCINGGSSTPPTHLRTSLSSSVDRIAHHTRKRLLNGQFAKCTQSSPGGEPSRPAVNGHGAHLDTEELAEGDNKSRSPVKSVVGSPDAAGSSVNGCVGGVNGKSFADLLSDESMASPPASPLHTPANPHSHGEYSLPNNKTNGL